LTGIWVPIFGRELRPEESLREATFSQRTVLGYLNEGEGTVLLDQREIRLQAGDFIYYPIDTWVTQRPRLDGPWDWYWVCLEGPVVEYWVHEFGWSVERMPLHLGPQPEVLSLFDALFEQTPHTALGSALISALAYQLLLQAGKSSGYQGEAVRRTTRVSAEEIISFLGRHLHETLTLADIADHFFLSRSQLTKIIHKATGLAPMHFLNHLRINRAKSLFYKYPNAAQVARLVGFEDPNYFYRVFRRTTGMTPGEFCRVHAVHPTEPAQLRRTLATSPVS